jgi:class 3 adenylate cyclase
VNITSRLEGLTKELEWAIIASGATINAAGRGVLTGRREKVLLKGREEYVEIFEVIGMELERGGGP